MAQAAPAREPLHNVQALRGIAAMLVTYIHYASSHRVNMPHLFGASSVEIFFLISGFIIAYTAGKSAKVFAIRRVIRVVPFYWLTTLAWIPVTQVFSSAQDGQLGAGRVIRTLLFLPSDPVMSRGWTLNYEMYFYGLFALAMVLSVKWAPLLCSVPIVGIWIVATARNSPGLSVFGFYGEPIALFFLIGMACYYVWHWTSGNERLRRLATTFRWPLVLLTVAGVVFSQYTEANLWNDLFWWVGVALVIAFLGCLYLEREAKVTVGDGLFAKLGDASYSMYMVHPFVILPLEKFFYPTAYTFSIPVRIAIFFILVLPAVCVASLILYKVVELPMTRAINNWYKRRAKGEFASATVAGRAI